MTPLAELLKESRALALCRVCSARGFRVSGLEAKKALTQWASLERALDGLLEERGFLARLIAPALRWHFQHRSGRAHLGGGRSR
jgi:hypothetical protein